MATRISVTIDDIADGLSGDECPIKLAVMRATALPAKSFGIGPIAMVLWETRRRIELPRPAKRFVARFDSERIVDPFEFELDI